MFMGTRRAPTKAFDAWMEAAGGKNNAWTAEDRTDYFDIAPPTALPLLLWLEADRMRDLGPLIDQIEARPPARGRPATSAGRASRTARTAWRSSSCRRCSGPRPIRTITRSSARPRTSRRRASSDVKDFFATWYDPANASIVVAGDFDPQQALALDPSALRRRPRPEESRKTPARPASPIDKSTLTGVVRQTVADNVELAKVTIAWQSPRHFAPGDAELDLLASVLAQGKESRLYKALVYDQKIAQEVSARQESHVLGSDFVVDALVHPGRRSGEGREGALRAGREDPRQARSPPRSSIARATVRDGVRRPLAEHPRARVAPQHVPGRGGRPRVRPERSRSLPARQAGQDLLAYGKEGARARRRRRSDHRSAQRRRPSDDASNGHGHGHEAVEASLSMAALAALPLAAGACASPTPAAAPVAPPPSASAPPVPRQPSPPTRSGRSRSRPPPAAFLPPTPEVFKATGGMTVWLLERHQVPLVSCDLTIPTGASSDPKGKGGPRVRHGAACSTRARESAARLSWRARSTTSARASAPTRTPTPASSR